MKTVLVIDDEDQVRSTLTRMLEAGGFRTLQARDGAEAVRVFDERYREIDAATLDLMMPGTDGREALVKFARYAWDLPIVVCTALEAPDDLPGRPLGSRGMGYIQKPFTIDALVKEVNRVIAEVEATPPVPRDGGSAQ
jgi:CheY-like chemotaxis protein